MKSSIRRLTLDIHRSQSQISIPVMLGDTSREFRIILSDGGEPYIIGDGCLAKLSIKRPTGTRIEEFCAVENNTTIVYDFMQNENTAAVEGVHECDISVYGLDGKVITTARFSMVVSDRVIAVDDVVLTDEDFTAVDAMLLEEAKRQVVESKRVIAENDRVVAENSRISAEKERISSEEERAVAEEERNSAETTRNSNENKRLSNEEIRVSKDAQRDASIKNAVDASGRAEANSKTALDKATNATEDVANIKQEFGTESLIIEQKTVKGSVNYAVSTANTAKEQSDITRTNLINLSAQVQGIGRTFVVPDFFSFIAFLNAGSSIELKEDRNGDGVDETYNVYISDLKSGDNIVIVETGVPDFWFERNSALTSFETYTYNDMEFVLSATASGATIGGAHILETDYTVIEGYATSSSASANSAKASEVSARESSESARESKDSASLSATEATTARDEAKSIADGMGVEQTTGNSTTAVMSQKAIRDNFEERSKNLLDCDNVELFNYNFGGSAVASSSKCKAFCIDISNYSAKKVTIHVDATTNRFNVGISNEPIGVGKQPSSVKRNEFSSVEKTITLDMLSGKTYLWCYFYNSNYDYLTPEEILATVMVQYGSVFTGYEPYYVTKHTAKIEKIGASVEKIIERSKNLLDWENISLFDYAIGAEAVSEHRECRSFCLEIKNYTSSKLTVHVGIPTNRLTVAISPTPLQIGNHGVSELVEQEFYAGNKKATLNLPKGTSYLWCYFYNLSYDDFSINDILSHIMVQYGDTFTGYEPYYVVKENPREDRWNTRNKVYGIQFNTEDETLSCERIADSVGKSGLFDNIYPWSDMRLCNLKVENGKKKIVYEGESTFTRDGTNGNVMVEIPAFYVCRERIGSTERWLISGEKKGGFELHPWFRNADGTAVEHRYYGVYKASIDMRNDGVFSHSGGTPFVYIENGLSLKYVRNFDELLSNSGYSRNTVYAVSAMQYLFCIEYATVNSQSIMNGVAHCPYFNGSSSTHLKIKNVGEQTNTLTVKNYVSKFGNTFTYLGEGMQVCVDTAKNKLVNKRNIVSIASDDSNIYVTVDGEPITVVEDMYCFPIPQDNGLTDNLSYHTGKLDTMNEKVAPFKYRNIENVWGNSWEALDGVRIVNGKYYLSNADNYHENSVGNWEILGYNAPMVTATDAVLTNRIVRMGMDNEHRTMCLPDLLSSDVPADMTYERMESLYFGGDAYYSEDEMAETAVYIPFYGGGWDHHENAGLFCMRFLNIDEYRNWLYGERITC